MFDMKSFMLRNPQPYDKIRYKLVQRKRRKNVVDKSKRNEGIEMTIHFTFDYFPTS